MSFLKVLNRDLRILFLKHYLDDLDNIMLQIAFFPKTTIVTTSHETRIITECIYHGYLNLIQYLQEQHLVLVAWTFWYVLVLYP